MSLAPREQEELTAIESELRATDPRFAVMFGVFDNRDVRGQGRLSVFLSVWVARRGLANAIIALATIMMPLTTCAAAIALLA